MKPRRVDWYALDWLDGVATLTPEERGVYDTIINLNYARGDAVEDNDEELAKRCNCHLRRYRRIRQTLIDRGKIHEVCGKLWANKCETELKRASNRVETASKHAQKRWSQSSENNGIADATAFPPAYANKQQTAYSIQQTTKDARASRASSNGAFDAWWEGYPEKVGKGAARRAFDRALGKTSMDVLTDGLIRYKRYKPVDRAWCNPATWLNQERWNDAFGNGADPRVPVRDPPTDAEREAARQEILQQLRAANPG